MAVGLIGTADSPKEYVNWTMLHFPTWREMEAFAKKSYEKRPNSDVDKGNAAFKNWVNGILQDKNDTRRGLFGIYLNGDYRHIPKDYDEAMARRTFLFYDEFNRIKKQVEKKIQQELKKNSQAEAMQPKLIYNDREIGEFVFDRAAMALVPEIYYYAPKLKREVDILSEKIIQDGDIMVLESDRSVFVVYALKVFVDGKDEPEYVELKGEESLAQASEMGIVDCGSTNKKVYLYKEKKPRMFNAIKIIVGMSGGAGWTGWQNDFYTGIAAGVITDVLEQLGYTVNIEVVLGGGRCNRCGMRLNFDGRMDIGRRFFAFTAKSFDEQADMDGLLYTLCDPTFHNVRWLSLFNSYLSFFGDEIQLPKGSRGNTHDEGNPIATWHAIESEDMINPIGMLYKKQDYDRGDKTLLHFYLHRVGDEAGVVQEITNLVITCENINLEALKIGKQNDFKFD